MYNFIDYSVLPIGPDGLSQAWVNTSLMRIGLKCHYAVQGNEQSKINAKNLGH